MGNRLVELGREDAIAIMDEKTIVMVRGNGFPQLLECPCRCRVGCHIAVQNPSGPVFDNDQDVALPDKTGIELISEIKKVSSKTIIMIISMHSKVDYIVKAFKAGATGYLVKDSAAERLLQGIDAVLRDEYFLDSSVSHKVIEKLMELPKEEARITDRGYDLLTSREQEILALLAEGLSTKEVAEKLFISPRTVENHRSSIMRKLDLHSNHDLIRYAAKLGLIDMESWAG